MNFIRKKAPEIHFQEKYVNHCHLCNDIFTRGEVRHVLSQYAHERIETITLQRGFLEALRFKDEEVRNEGVNS